MSKLIVYAFTILFSFSVVESTAFGQGHGSNDSGSQKKSDSKNNKKKKKKKKNKRKGDESNKNLDQLIASVTKNDPPPQIQSPQIQNSEGGDNRRKNRELKQKLKEMNEKKAEENRIKSRRHKVIVSQRSIQHTQMAPQIQRNTIEPPSINIGLLEGRTQRHVDSVDRHFQLIEKLFKENNHFRLPAFDRFGNDRDSLFVDQNYFSQRLVHLFDQPGMPTLRSSVRVIHLFVPPGMAAELFNLGYRIWLGSRTSSGVVSMEQLPENCPNETRFSLALSLRNQPSMQNIISNIPDDEGVGHELRRLAALLGVQAALLFELSGEHESLGIIANRVHELESFILQVAPTPDNFFAICHRILHILMDMKKTYAHYVEIANRSDIDSLNHLSIAQLACRVAIQNIHRYLESFQEDGFSLEAEIGQEIFDFGVGIFPLMERLQQYSSRINGPVENGSNGITLNSLFNLLSIGERNEDSTSINNSNIAFSHSSNESSTDNNFLNSSDISGSIQTEEILESQTGNLPHIDLTPPSQTLLFSGSDTINFNERSERWKQKNEEQRNQREEERRKRRLSRIINNQSQTQNNVDSSQLESDEESDIVLSAEEANEFVEILLNTCPNQDIDALYALLNPRQHGDSYLVNGKITIRDLNNFIRNFFKKALYDFLVNKKQYSGKQIMEFVNLILAKWTNSEHGWHGNNRSDSLLTQPDYVIIRLGRVLVTYGLWSEVILEKVGLLEHKVIQKSLRNLEKRRLRMKQK